MLQSRPRSNTSNPPRRWPDLSLGHGIWAQIGDTRFSGQTSQGRLACWEICAVSGSQSFYVMAVAEAGGVRRRFCAGAPVATQWTCEPPAPVKTGGVAWPCHDRGAADGGKRCDVLPPAGPSHFPCSPASIAPKAKPRRSGMIESSILTYREPEPRSCPHGRRSSKSGWNGVARVRSGAFHACAADHENRQKGDGRGQ